jgi:hypothetical protein
MLPHKASDFLRRLKRRRTWKSPKWDGGSVFDHSPSDDSGAESEPEDIPPIKSGITQIYETCTKIDLAFLLQRPGKFMREASKPTYGLGSLQEIQAKEGEC